MRDFAGLWQERPGLAGLLTVFSSSLGGFPPTVGFVAKRYIFNAAVQENLLVLLVLGVLTSVVSVFFYLRIVVQMDTTMKPGARTRRLCPRDGAGRTTLALVAVVYLGALPGRLLTVAAESAIT